MLLASFSRLLMTLSFRIARERQAIAFDVQEDIATDIALTIPYLVVPAVGSQSPK